MSAEAEPLAVASAKLSSARQAFFSPLAIRVALLGITFLAYASTLGYRFVFDDTGQIVANPLIKSWHYLPQYFTGHVWAYIDPSQHCSYYRPLFLVWLLINHTLFGLNPEWWHLTSVLVHLGVTYLVFMLARRLLKNETEAAIAALLFGLHPVHIESVAWISGITDPMLALFFIPAFLFYLRWREAKTSPIGEPGHFRLYHKPAFNLALSLLFFLLALLSKETALVLPGIILVYEWVYGERGSRWATAVKRIIPFAAAAAVYLIARTLALKALGYSAWPLPLSVTLLTVPSLLWFYIRLLVWPVGLSAFYDTPYVTHADATFWLMVAGLAAIVAGLWMWGRKSKPVAIAIALLVLPILPVLNLPVFSEKEIAHDRYLYLPSIGFAILLAVAIGKLRFGKPWIISLPAAQAGVTIAGMLAFAALTLQQSVYYTTDLELCKRGIIIAPNNDLALTNYADELLHREQLDEAIPIYETVINRNPTYSRASYNIGSCFIHKGDQQTALIYRVRSKEMDTLFSDQVSLAALVCMRLGRMAEATAMFQRAVAAHPEVPAYQYGLGIVLKETGDREDALAAFKASALSSPDPRAAQTQIAELEDSVSHDAPNASASIK